MLSIVSGSPAVAGGINAVAIVAPHHGQDDDEQGAHVGSDVILS